MLMDCKRRIHKYVLFKAADLLLYLARVIGAGQAPQLV
jgi:hypothetical protein